MAPPRNWRRAIRSLAPRVPPAAVERWDLLTDQVVVALVPELAAHRLPEGVTTRAISPGSGRDIFALIRRGGDRHPAARVVLDHLSRAAGR
jgi:DNA-binding transcriptional LysR family regulator